MPTGGNSQKEKDEERSHTRFEWVCHRPGIHRKAAFGDFAVDSMMEN
jgi:hypothetical protein